MIQTNYIERFCREEGVVAPPRPKPNADWLLVETAFHLRSGGDDLYMRQLERDLEFAYQASALNRDRRSRLLSRDKSKYFGVLGELRAGRRLTSGGAIITEWDPQGRGTRQGEFLLTDNSGDIFTEVKTHFGSLPMQSSSDRADSLKLILFASKRIPKSIDIVVDVSNSGSGHDQYREGDLIGEIIQLAKKSANEEITITRDFLYSDCDVRVEVRSAKYEDRMTLVSSGEMADPADALLRTLKNAVRPSDHAPYLIASYDYSMWLLEYFDPVGISQDVQSKLVAWLSESGTSTRLPDAVYLFGEISDESVPDGTGLREHSVLLARRTDGGEKIVRLVNKIKTSAPIILSL